MILGWIISLVTIFLTIFGYDILDPKHLENVIYNTVFRSTWSIALAFIVFATAKVIHVL